MAEFKVWATYSVLEQAVDGYRLVRRNFPSKVFELWYAFYPARGGNGYCYAILCIKKTAGRTPNIRLLRKIDVT